VAKVGESDITSVLKPFRGDTQMTAKEDLDAVIEHYHLAAAEFVKGDPEPYKNLFSQRDDVSLGNPFGPFTTGWKSVAATMERASALYKDGEIIGFENLTTYVTPELAYIVEVERIKAKIGGRDQAAIIALRTTSVFRPEAGTWKIVHRHADPITTHQSAESVVQK
jgi:ketosteroid isomerase-like protein